MVSVGGHPFLYWLFAHYAGLGFGDFIISTGHRAELVEGHPWSAEFPGARFRFAREPSPLGTGGAVQAAFRAHSLERAWVVNGDTFLPTPLPEPAAELEALFTALAPGEVFDAAPNLHVKNGFVTSEGPGGQLFDAGAVYLTAAAALAEVGPPPFSLHRLLAPAMARHAVGCAVVEGTCYDIGTPERYRRFEDYLSRFMRQRT